MKSRRGTITVSISKILLFDRDNIPKKFCLQRRNHTLHLNPPSWAEFHSSFFPNHKCDKIVVPNSGQCSLDNYDELIFIADTSLQRFRPRCVMPEKSFWKTWKLMEARNETHCHLWHRSIFVAVTCSAISDNWWWQLLGPISWKQSFVS